MTVSGVSCLTLIFSKGATPREMVGKIIENFDTSGSSVWKVGKTMGSLMLAG